MDNDSLTAALSYAKRRGWSVFPVPFGTKQSHKSARKNGGRAWGMTANPAEIERDFTQWPEAGVGVPTGLINGMFVLETDTIAGHGVDGAAGLRALVIEHRYLPDTLMAESPTGSIHRYFAWPRLVGVDIRNSDSKLAPGVDIRGNGGMVVAPPTKTKKGQYRWLNDLPIADPPRWLVKLIDQSPRARRRPRARNAKRKPVSGDQLRELMESIPNDDRTTWEDWNRVGMALYDATDGSDFGLELFDAWSAKREDKYDPEITDAKWQAFETSPPDRIGVGTLFFLAQCAQFEAELEAIEVLKRQGDWLQTPVGDAFDDLPPGDEDDEDEPPLDLWNAIDTPELPVGLLPARVETFVRANARAIGADSGGLAGASIAALAAATPDSVKLQVQARGRKWLIAARIWMALVGDPSTKKTPIMDAALAALRAKDMERRRRYAALKALWDALSKKEKAEALAARRGPPDHNRLIINDTTAEAAGEILTTSPNGVIGVYDELSGWFGQMERYGKSGQGLSERGFWLQARNGGPHSIDRIIRGTNYIPNLSITLIGGIQPEPMRKVAGNSSDDGLIQRLTPIMLHPAELTDDSVDTEEADKDFAALIDALIDLTPTVRPLKFDQGAQTIRRELEIEHHERMRSWEPINKKMSSAFGKQDGYFAELCVIWHCAENAGQDPLPTVVAEDTARRAATFMRDFLRPHLVAFYRGLLDLSDEHDRLRAIAGYILTHKPDKMNSREVQKAVRSMRNLGSRDVTSIMEQLVAFGWLFRRPPPRYGALPVWKINPAVHVQFAEQAKEEAARRARDRATIAKDVAARRAAKV
jgi:Protein of unknown function (DUF3987)/Bifunctional DNA primase/polymerase, N-terminal/Primase C terminal 2 (PriCT-2)